MDKRYQVFISSTYTDLQVERQRVIQTIMELDCIPSGMELFPAVDEEQWAFIRRVIDDCDYYLLIIGGRYGSITSEGISYTEKEYDYAIEKEIKVIALLHSNPEDISIGKSELTPELRERLQAFREKVSKNRLVKTWKIADELPGLVALSLSKTIKTYPAIGWIRADQVSNTKLLNELNELRKKKEELEKEISEFRRSPKINVPDLASLDEQITIQGFYSKRDRYEPTGYKSYSWEFKITWGELFALLAPHLLNHPNDIIVKNTIKDILSKKIQKAHSTFDIDDEIFQTIKIQLQALGLVKVQYLAAVNNQMGLFWSLTQDGHNLMMTLRAVKASSISPDSPDN